MSLRADPERMRFTDRLDVIAALILRDLMSRFGRNSLGFVWVVLEPMILTAGVMVIWSAIRPAVYHGVPIVAFVLTCYMPLTLWRHMTNPLIRILRNNFGLLHHRVIRHSDIIIARLVLEFLSTSAALAVVYFVLRSVGLAGDVANPGLMLGAWLYTAWFFSGIGMLQSAWTERSELAEKFITPSQYLALPISGVFFMVGWMPGYAQKLLLLNPMVHCFEMFRAGYFGPSIESHYDIAYLAVWCMISSTLGMAAIHLVRNQIDNS